MGKKKKKFRFNKKLGMQIIVWIIIVALVGSVFLPALFATTS